MRPSLLVLSVALPLLAFSPVGDELAFHVADDSTLVKTFEHHMQLDLANTLIEADGEEIEVEDMQVSIESSNRYVFTDHYRKVEAGRPTLVVRTFDELEGHDEQSIESNGETGGEARDESSPLEGHSVRFQWNAEEERYDASYEGDGGDGALLDELVEDTDMRAFLPPSSVGEGDTWSVEASAFDAIFNPGGELGMASDDDAEDSKERSKLLRENYEGRIQATLEGYRETEDGVRVAVVHLKCTINTHSETESSEDSVTTRERFEVEIEAEGELLWDVVHGHPCSFDLPGSTTVVMRNSHEGEMEGQTFAFSQTMTFEGTLGFSGEWSAAKD